MSAISPPSDAKAHAGNLYVVVAPSGAGKTSLLNILAELETPGTGSVDRRPTNTLVIGSGLYLSKALATANCGVQCGWQTRCGQSECVEEKLIFA